MTTTHDWTYFNVLEALAGKLPVGKYEANGAEWASVIWDLRETYESDHPELFSQIHFVRRSKKPVFSHQVSEFLVLQSFAGLKQAINPAFEYMEISEEAQAELQGRNAELLESYGEILTEMAGVLKTRLWKDSTEGTP